MRHIDLEKLEELSPFESIHARRILARTHDEKRKQQKRRDDRRTDEQEAA